MNSVELNNILKQDSCTRNYFVGVFAANRIPMPRDKRYTKYFMICNLDNANQPGSHWVVVILERKLNKLKAQYFDPVGLAPLNYNIVNYLNNFDWTYNKVQLQGPTSNICGQYCIYFIRERCRGRSMQEITKYLSTKPDRDCFVLDYVKKVYGFPKRKAELKKFKC